eukprot:scaffold16267_cov16-Prasinocladus_malaysianus.AAC.1
MSYPGPVSRMGFVRRHYDYSYEYEYYTFPPCASAPADVSDVFTGAWRFHYTYTYESYFSDLRG